MNKALACHCEPKEEIGHEIGTVLALDLKREDGDSFMDRSVYGHLCTNYGSKWQLDGRYFDGISNKVACGDVGIGVNGPASIVFHLYLNRTAIQRGAYNGIFSQAGGLYQHTANDMLYQVMGNSLQYFSGALVSKLWYPLELIYDGQYSTTRVYQSGNEKVMGNPQNIDIPALDNFQVGYSAVGDGGWLEGLMGKVSIYNFADYTPRILSRSIGG